MLNSIKKRLQTYVGFVRLRHALIFVVILIAAIFASIGNFGLMILAAGVLLGFGLTFRGLSMVIQRLERPKPMELGPSSVKQIAANVYGRNVIKLEGDGTRVHQFWTKRGTPGGTDSEIMLTSRDGFDIFIHVGGVAVKIRETFGRQAGGFLRSQSKDIPVSMEEARHANFDYDYRMGIGGCRVDLQLHRGLAQTAGGEGRRAGCGKRKAETGDRRTEGGNANGKS
jgi:hypothetical protein